MFKLLYQFIKSYISFTSLLFNRELEEYAKEWNGEKIEDDQKI